ncbi:hypothetical protein CDL12_12314 [Handroanthus impetiginosus]|uniref:DRBM domain-containing protein n=1 Tax=Handroanthus impetiginosus TaxID=429701 RepID=A0A2G9HC00_9LAMI|nr:hypothetical protein CDL12_12314 [Handroanthus impetiginosus]
MYKNQLQELAQRSCFNLPSYTCIREGPDHAPRFKAIVNFNGENFESPNYCSTLRQAEHSAAEAALISLSSRGPSHSLAARILDETGVYKNLLQEIAQRVGSPLPKYTTFRSGLGHLPVFTGVVQLAGITFTGEPAKNKKQAEKNAALAAWLSLKQLANQGTNSSSEQENSDEQEQIRIARALQNYRLKEKLVTANLNGASVSFQRKFSIQSPRPSSPQRPPACTSKILPLFSQKPPQNRPPSVIKDSHNPSSQEIKTTQGQRFPAVGAAPYVPMRQCYQGIAPPVTMRTQVPVFSAPPAPRPARMMHPQAVRAAPPVSIRQVIPAFAAPSGLRDNPTSATSSSTPSKELLDEDDGSLVDVDESTAVKCVEQLEI